MSATDTLAGYAEASTQRVLAADSATEYAYRELGESDVPLVLLQHFRGNLDNWDPGLVDAYVAVELSRSLAYCWPIVQKLVVIQ